MEFVTSRNTQNRHCGHGRGLQGLGARTRRREQSLGGRGGGQCGFTAGGSETPLKAARRQSSASTRWCRTAAASPSTAVRTGRGGRHCAGWGPVRKEAGRGPGGTALGATSSERGRGRGAGGSAGLPTPDLRALLCVLRPACGSVSPQKHFMLRKHSFYVECI